MTEEEPPPPPTPTAAQAKLAAARAAAAAQAQASKSSSATSTSAAKVKPIEPKFGGITEISDGHWATWTGGKPKANWTELEQPQPGHIGPNQFRSTSIASQAKSEHYRTTGLETKFGRDKDLHTFQRKVLDHLERYGLDTITYLKDPSDATRLTCVITDHGRFNINDGAKDANATAQTHFD